MPQANSIRLKISELIWPQSKGKKTVKIPEENENIVIQIATTRPGFTLDDLLIYVEGVDAPHQIYVGTKDNKLSITITPPPTT